MAQIINIDTENNLDQVIKVLIEGNSYIFRLRYNDRSQWQLGVYDPKLYNINAESNIEAKLYGERRLMPNHDFFKYSHSVPTLPTGVLMLYDTLNPDRYTYKLPDRFDLGQDKRFVLVYLTKEDVGL